MYLADYAILEDIPTIHRDTDIRFLTSPIVLFYVREFGELIPLAIQLGQTPSPENPVWTPRDAPEDWILAKLWVRCADFHYQFAISHLLKTHFIVEPFAIATMRQLSSSHPVYKLLKPHFRSATIALQRYSPYYMTFRNFHHSIHRQYFIIISFALVVVEAIIAAIITSPTVTIV